MSFFADADMEAFQDLDESAMPSTCRVLRRTDEVLGGRVTPGAEQQVGSAVPCRLTGGALQPREAEAVGRLGEQTHGDVALPLGTDVRGGDRIEVTTDEATTTFEVVGDPWPASFGTSLAATVTRED